MSDLLPVVGIDISKATFDVHWGSQKGKIWQARFPNDTHGLALFHAWILEHEQSQVLCCLEATATYSDAVATFCFAQGYHVSMVPPHKIHAFRISEGILSKTDKIDARLLSLYAQQKRPPAWHPVSACAMQLKRDLDRLDELKAMHQQEKNRLENQRLDPEARKEIQEHLDWLSEKITSWIKRVEERFTQAYKQEQAPEPEAACTPPSAGKKEKQPRKKPLHIAPVDALMQVIGVGRLSALRLYAVFATLQDQGSSEQVASYFGVVPHLQESGTSVKGKTRRRGGNRQARSWLYMAALVSKRSDPQMREWAHQLKARGLCHKAVMVAVMHKLVRILFGIYKTQEPYDARKAFPKQFPVAQEKNAA